MWLEQVCSSAARIARATSMAIVGPAGRTLSTLGLAVSCNNYVCST